MDSVEIIVFLAIAVIIGGLIIAFVAGIDGSSLYGNVKNLFQGEHDLEYERVNTTEFPRSVFGLWEMCGLGKWDMNKTVFLDDTGAYSKIDLMLALKRYGLCKSVQWGALKCGLGDDVRFDGADAFPLPAVVTIHCSNVTRDLEIITGAQCDTVDAVCVDVGGLPVEVRSCDVSAAYASNTTLGSCVCDSATCQSQDQTIGDCRLPACVLNVCTQDQVVEPPHSACDVDGDEVVDGGYGCEADVCTCDVTLCTATDQVIGDCRLPDCVSGSCQQDQADEGSGAPCDYDGDGSIDTGAGCLSGSCCLDTMSDADVCDAWGSSGAECGNIPDSCGVLRFCGACPSGRCTPGHQCIGLPH